MKMDDAWKGVPVRDQEKEPAPSKKILGGFFWGSLLFAVALAVIGVMVTATGH